MLRMRLGLPVVALVGYTNAGKSTLLNRLSRAGVLAENMLFATLGKYENSANITPKQTIYYDSRVKWFLLSMGPILKRNHFILQS